MSSAESLRDAIAAAPCLKGDDNQWDFDCHGLRLKHPECAEAAALKWFAGKVMSDEVQHRVALDLQEPRDWPVEDTCGECGRPPTADMQEMVSAAIADALADALTKENPHE